jgi:predicted amidohydrolase YtcJ
MAARLTAYIVAFIVSVTFIAGLLVGAQRDDGPVDLIVVNGNVYTADGDGTMAEAVAVQGNKILLVGSNREVQRLRRPQTVVVDARGGAVLPGFNDSHVDFIGSGLALEHVDLEGADTLLAVESTIKAWAATNPDREWVLGSGWTFDAFDEQRPTRQLLDALIEDRPALLVSADGTTAWANSEALERAQIRRGTPNPANGSIARDARTGEPTGLLRAEAIELVRAAVPRPTRDESEAALRAAISEAHRRGVTSVQDVLQTTADFAVYDSVREDEALEVRVYAAVRGDVDMTAEEIDAIDRVRAKYKDDPLFKAGAIEVAVEEGDEASRHKLQDLVAELDARGWQVVIRAIGDHATRLAMDVLAYAGRGGDRLERRHRVEAADATLDRPVKALQLAVFDGHTPTDAIDAVTTESAVSSFDEHRKGSLERDMLADLVVLTHDIFSLPPGRIGDADVAYTIFDGRVVYTRPTESND